PALWLKSARTSMRGRPIPRVFWRLSDCPSAGAPRCGRQTARATAPIRPTPTAREETRLRNGLSSLRYAGDGSPARGWAHYRAPVLILSESRLRILSDSRERQGAGPSARGLADGTAGK